MCTHRRRRDSAASCSTVYVLATLPESESIDDSCRGRRPQPPSAKNRSKPPSTCESRAESSSHEGRAPERCTP
jgi:hypothetical protein